MRRAALLGGCLVALAPAASACPACLLGTDASTLFTLLAFMAVPYLVVSATWMWIRRLLAEERETA